MLAQSRWRSVTKTTLRKFGFDVIQFRPESSDGAKIFAALQFLKTDLVLDIGANAGQYGKSLREYGYRGRIASFEPLTSAHARLLETAARDSSWTVHPRCAIGDQDSEVQINIAGNNVSSSVLPMLSHHAEAAPESKYIGSETVPLFRLDSVAPAYVANAKSVFIKIDTQGFEAQVLNGATSVLAGARALQLEMSLTPLYEGQQLWDYFLDYAKQRGFVLWTLLPGFVEESTGRTLQVDAIFIRH